MRWQRVGSFDDAFAVAEEAFDETGLGFWVMETICYAILLVVVLVCAGKARWTAALVGFAAMFDLMLDFVPLVPTILLVIAFFFFAKAPTEFGVANPED